MKVDFSKFQLSKKAMNALQGGVNTVHSCSCGGSSVKFLISSESREILQAKLNTECKGDSFARCTLLEAWG